MVVETQTVVSTAINGSAGENLAAYVCGIDDLKVQPFKLPPLGLSSTLLNVYLLVL